MPSMWKYRMAWKYRRQLWKYRGLWKHRKGIAAGAAMGLGALLYMTIKPRIADHREITPA